VIGAQRGDCSDSAALSLRAGRVSVVFDVEAIRVLHLALAADTTLASARS